MLIVPTLGESPFFSECLARIKSECKNDCEIVVVHSGPTEISDFPAELASRVLRDCHKLGFADACNWGFRETQSDLVAVVNDDVLLQSGWLKEMRRLFLSDSAVAAAQGVNLSEKRPDTIDGCGLAWNRLWRPVQIGQGAPYCGSTSRLRPVFGVSGAACMYRRAAVENVSLGALELFDPALGSFYEDVELAIRLRAAGHQAVTLFSAQALHYGGATSARMSKSCHRLRFCNRILVLARVSGRRFFFRAPLLLARDAVELGLDLVKFRVASASAGVAGWLRASRLIMRYVHLGKAFAPDSSFPFQVRQAGSWPRQWAFREDKGSS